MCKGSGAGASVGSAAVVVGWLLCLAVSESHAKKMRLPLLQKKGQNKLTS